MNRVVLVGRITKDPELRTTPNGVHFVGFSIAVNRNVPNSQGERVADFINCVVFNKQAENLARYVKKGALIGVEGRIQTRTYTDQQGINRNATDIVCDTITFLSSAQGSSNQGSYSDYSSYTENFNQEYQPQNNQRRPMQEQRPAQQTQPVQPVQQESFNQTRENEFSDVEMQSDVLTDDLPF